MSSCKKASPVLGAALFVVLESRRAGGLASISTRSWSVFDSFDRGSFTVLVQLLIMTDQQQTDVFVKFRHLTHERSHSSRKQVCKFCVSGGSSGPEGRLEIGVPEVPEVPEEEAKLPSAARASFTALTTVARKARPIEPFRADDDET